MLQRRSTSLIITLCIAEHVIQIVLTVIVEQLLQQLAQVHGKNVI